MLAERTAHCDYMVGRGEGGEGCWQRGQLIVTTWWGEGREGGEGCWQRGQLIVTTWWGEGREGGEGCGQVIVTHYMGREGGEGCGQLIDYMVEGICTFVPTSKLVSLAAEALQ